MKQVMCLAHEDANDLQEAVNELLKEIAADGEELIDIKYSVGIAPDERSQSEQEENGDDIYTPHRKILSALIIYEAKKNLT